MIGCSSTIPAAPRMSRAIRAVSSAIHTLFILAIETCWGRTPGPVLEPAELEAQELRLRDLRDHPHERWTSWKPAMGLPNWTRVCAYWSAQS